MDENTNIQENFVTAMHMLEKTSNSPQEETGSPVKKDHAIELENYPTGGQNVALNQRFN